MNLVMTQRTVTPNVGRNKSSQFRHGASVTPLPELRKALVRPTGELSSLARLVGAAVLLLAGCNAAAPTTVAPANSPAASSSPTEVTLYLAGMNESLQIL
jgi:hypothetical protein